MNIECVNLCFFVILVIDDFCYKIENCDFTRFFHVFIVILPQKPFSL